MKDFFSDYCLKGWLTKRPIWWWILLLACYAGGSYLAGRFFGILTSLLLAMATIFIGGAVTAYLYGRNWSERAPVFWIKKAPRIALAWDYRPKDIKQRNVTFEREQEQAAGITGLNSSAPNENDDVWYNFMSAERLAEHALPSSEGADGTPAYDQSPIDIKRRTVE